MLIRELQSGWQASMQKSKAKRALLSYSTGSNFQLTVSDLTRPMSLILKRTFRSCQQPSSVVLCKKARPLVDAELES